MQGSNLLPLEAYLKGDSCKTTSFDCLAIWIFLIFHRRIRIIGPIDAATIPTLEHGELHQTSAVSMYIRPGLASSSTGRIFGAAGPFFGSFERVFDRLIEILAQNGGVFRPVLPDNPGTPPGNGSIGTPHRN
jgi:hypothetical protein